MTKSANDVAVVVAENLGGSEEAFAEQMTRKARALGMTRTVYRNASGLPDPEQVTTARDLTILGRAIQDRFPKQYRYFQTRVFHYAGAAYRNHNKLLGRVEGVDGIKTGFTRASGFNLLTSAKTDDRHIVAVVLGGRSGGAPRRRHGLARRDQPAPRLCRRPHRADDRGGVGAAAPGGRRRGDPAARRAAGRRDGDGRVPGSGRSRSRSTSPRCAPVASRRPRRRACAGARAAQPIPAAAQAYAPVEAAVAPPPRPHPLVEPAPAAVAAAKIEARLPEMTRREAGARARPEIVAKAEPRRAAAAGGGASPAPRLARPGQRVGSSSSAPWTTRTRPRRSSTRRAAARAGVLAKASPFTEKVVARRRDALPGPLLRLRRSRFGAGGLQACSSATASPASRPGADAADRPRRARPHDRSDTGPFDRPRSGVSAMSAQQNVLGLVDAGREIGRAALVGVELLHQRAMRAPDLLGARPRLQGPGSGRPPLPSSRPACAPAARPRVRVALSVFTPAGKPAVEIRL